MRSPGMQQFRQRVIASYHLGPLDSEETRAYIEHRLKHVGWKGDPRIEEEAFDMVHACAGGVPRRINTLFHRVLLAAYLAERHSIGSNEIDDVVAELRSEFGNGAVTGPTANSNPGAGSAENGARSPTVVVDAADVMRLERRIARVEKAMTTTISLLRQVIVATNARSASPVPGKKETG
jgi:general secretion pathway protein A